MEKPGLVESVRAVPRALREDFWVAVVESPPGAGRPGSPPALLILPLVMAAGVLLIFHGNWYSGDHGLGVFGLVLAGVQATALVAAPYLPVPAWWASTLAEAVVVGAALWTDAPAGARGWTGTELALQSWVLFFVALRARFRFAVAALAADAVIGLAFVLATGHAGEAPFTLASLAMVAVLGTLLRVRQTARTQLAAQRGAIAEERTQRTHLEERTRIARELHDVVAHHMSVVSIQAQVAPHLVENPSGELRENLAGIRQHANEALAELRQVLGVLRSAAPQPDADRHAPLPGLARLDELIANLRAVGLMVSIATTGEPCPLPPSIELSAYRIVQEALSNVVRHAPGAEARVEIGYRPAGLTVRVVNTAPDRPATALPAPGVGHGLLGMRERTDMLGGELVTGATPDGGYEVTAMLPTKPFAGPGRSVEATP